MESQDDHRSGVMGGGVPIWHMGEDGPSQTVFPLPSGTGTDREIDQWLEQTRAVARLHQRSVLPSGPVVSGGYCMHPIYQGYDFHPPPTIMPTNNNVPPNGGKPAAALLRPVASGWQGGAVGDGGCIRRGGGIQQDPSSIQDLRAMLATGVSSEGAACRDGGSRDADSTSARPTRHRQHDIQQRDKPQRSSVSASTPPAARAPITARTGPGTSPTLAPAAVSAGGASPKRKGRRPPKKVSGKLQSPLLKPAQEYADICIFPRRKAGQSGVGSNRPPVVITREVLEKNFNMPLLSVCKKMGLCATVLKKVCRQLGVFKWPYKETKLIARRQGRVIEAAAPIPADLRNINAAVALASTKAAARSNPSPTLPKRKTPSLSEEAASTAAASTAGGSSCSPRRATRAKKQKVPATTATWSQSRRSADAATGQTALHTGAIIKGNVAAVVVEEDVAQLSVSDGMSPMSAHVCAQWEAQDEQQDVCLVRRRNCGVAISGLRDEAEEGEEEARVVEDSEQQHIAAFSRQCSNVLEEEDSGVSGLWREGGVASVASAQRPSRLASVRAKRHDTPPGLLDATGSDRETVVDVDDLEEEEHEEHSHVCHDTKESDYYASSRQHYYPYEAPWPWAGADKYADKNSAQCAVYQVDRGAARNSMGMPHAADDRLIGPPHDHHASLHPSMLPYMRQAMYSGYSGHGGAVNGGMHGPALAGAMHRPQHSVHVPRMRSAVTSSLMDELLDLSAPVDYTAPPNMAMGSVTYLRDPRYKAKREAHHDDVNAPQYPTIN